MSYLTDKLRAESASLRGETEITHVPGQMLEDVLNNAQVKRRSLLRGSFGASVAALFGGAALSACGGGDDDPVSTPAATENYQVAFSKVDARVGTEVWVPPGYTAEVVYSAGDALVGTVAYAGTPLSLADLERVGGGQHDGMHFFAIPGQDPNKRGLLAINHENTDDFMLDQGTRSAADQVTANLSNVGVAIVEVRLNEATNRWEKVAGSAYNKRYTGNTNYQIQGPAQGQVGGDTVIGTLNNCSSGATPWGTYLTCEETTDNYFDPTKDERGYGWVVEIDPLGELAALATPVKHTAMGRFSHENTAYRVGAGNRVAFYMGDDTTPGAIYKFIPNAAYDPNNRQANVGLLDNGKLYAARFNADGTGTWLELTQGLNGLVVGASDPGRSDRSPAPTPTTVNFATQADVVIQCQAAARVVGATQMDRPEWITVGPDGKIYCTLTNNSGRTAVNEANPRPNNSHGHIIQWTEDGNDVLATTFRWEIFLLAGSQKLANNLRGNINGDEFSSPDGIRVDPQGRLWVQTDASTSSGTTNIFGNNSMYYVDQTTKRSSRFLVGPDGCEITGLAYTPDLKTFFVNIQHPGTGWPTAGAPGRSSTVVVRRTDGKPVGA